MIAIIDVNHSFHKSYFIFKNTQPNYDLEDPKYKGILMRKAATDLAASVNKLYKSPSEVYFCFDSSSWRKRTDSEYKSSRSGKEQGFYDVINELYEIMFQNGYNAVKAESAESDDCIAVICHSFSDESKVIISADEDMHQLIDKNTCVWNNNLKKPIVFRNLEDNRSILKIQHDNVVVNPKLSLFKKIMLGCEGDEVSPLINKKGVGEKTIEKIYNTSQIENPTDILEIKKAVEDKLNFTRPDFIAKAHLNIQLVSLQFENLPISVSDSILDSLFKISEPSRVRSNSHSAEEFLRNTIYFKNF